MKVLFCYAVIAVFHVSTYALKEHKVLEMATDSHASYESQVEAQKVALRSLMKETEGKQKEVFKVLDPDSDGAISVEEMVKNGVEEGTAKLFMERLDVDLDGKVNMFELFNDNSPETGYFHFRQARAMSKANGGGSDLLGPSCLYESDYKKYWQWVADEIRKLPTMTNDNNTAFTIPQAMANENFKADLRSSISNNPSGRACRRIATFRKLWEFSSGTIFDMVKGPFKFQKWMACDVQEQAKQIRADPIGMLVTGIPKNAEAREAAAKRVEERIIGSKDGCNQYDVQKYQIDSSAPMFDFPRINIELPKITLPGLYNITEVVATGKKKAADHSR